MRRGVSRPSSGRSAARVGFLALLLGGIAMLVSAVADAPNWVTTVAALTTFGVTVMVEPFLAQAERNRSESISLRRAAPETASGNLPRVRDLDNRAFQVRTAIHDVGYFKRSVDEDLMATLLEGRRALIVGRSMSGRSRMIAEAARTRFPNHRLWVPSGPAAVMELLAQGHKLSRTIILLDNFDRFTAGEALTSTHLESALGRDNLVVATLRSSALGESTSMSADGPLRPETVDWFCEPVWVPVWSESEVRQVLSDEESTGIPTDAAVAYGISGYLGGSQLLIQRFEAARAEGSLPIQLLELLIAMSRCGLTRGISTSSIGEIVLGRKLERPETLESLEAALAWCMSEVAPGLAMVEVDKDEPNRLRIMEMLVERSVSRASTVLVADHWAIALQQAHEQDLVEVGEHAYFEHDLHIVALDAWERSSSPVAKFYIAQHFVNATDEADWKRAEGLLRDAMEELDEPEVKTVLAITLEKLAGGEYANVEESRQLYRQAADAGETIAAFNAGVSALRTELPGWQLEAEKYLRQALDAGHPRAAGRLSSLVHDSGRVVEAKELLEVAANSIDGDPDDAAAFGNLLIDEGETLRGQIWLERAVSRGSAHGAAYLANHLLNSDDHKDLARASLLIDAVDESQFQGVTALRGLVAIARGLTAEGEAILRNGHAAGDVQCAIQLATFLFEREVRYAFAFDARVQLSDIPSEVFELLLEAGNAGVPDAHNRASMFYYSLELFDEAVGAAELAAAVSDDPSIETLAQWGTALLARGDVADLRLSSEVLERALVKSQNLPEEIGVRLRNNLGIAYRELGKDKSAQICFALAATAGSVNAMGHYSDMLAARRGLFNAVRSRYWRRKQLRTLILLQKQDWSDGNPEQISPSAIAPNKEMVRLKKVRREGRRDYVKILSAKFRSLPGPNEIWSICFLCKAPFVIASGAFVFATPEGIQHLATPGSLVAASCRGCSKPWRRSRGLPLLEIANDDDNLVAVRANSDQNLRGPLHVALLLRNGRLSLAEGIDWLSRSDGPLKALSEALKDETTDATVAAGVVAACAALMVSSPAGSLERESCVATVLAFYELHGSVPALDIRVERGSLHYVLEGAHDAAIR